MDLFECALRLWKVLERVQRHGQIVAAIMLRPEFSGERNIVACIPRTGTRQPSLVDLDTKHFGGSGVCEGEGLIADRTPKVDHTPTLDDVVDIREVTLQRAKCVGGSQDRLRRDGISGHSSTEVGNTEPLG